MIDNEKNILNEKELEGVSGGKSASGKGKSCCKDGVTPTEMHLCSTCGKNTVHIVYSGGRPICKVCGTQYMG